MDYASSLECIAMLRRTSSRYGMDFYVLLEEFHLAVNDFPHSLTEYNLEKQHRYQMKKAISYAKSYRESSNTRFK